MVMEHTDTSDEQSAAAFNAAMAQFIIPPGSNLAVAVSGGSDSMALVLLLLEWSNNVKVSIHTLTVDHCLRDSSSAESAQVSDWLAARNIAHTVLRWDDGAQKRKIASSPQHAARNARYDLMNHWCATNGFGHLLVAHHADDQVETFLMRLARGSGIEGLSAMSPMIQRGGIFLLRPLLNFTKAQLAEVCRARGQNWIDDPSNNSDSSTRVRFRKSQEILEREGFTRQRLLNTVGHLRRAKLALDQSVVDFFKVAGRFDGYGVARLSVQKLVNTPEEIGLRTISRILMAVSGAAYGPRFKNLQGLYDRIVSRPWRDATLHGCFVQREGDNLLVCRETAKIAASLQVAINKNVVWDGRFRVSLFSDISNGPKQSFSISRMSPSVWRIFRVENPQSSLENVPARIRETLPIISDSNRLVAVPHADYLCNDYKSIFRAQVEFIPEIGSSLPIMGMAAKISHPK
ncbi:MAG: tRNA lysidine(34) synthetase TilS [Candidatus Marinimicrobia bacterium]|nr:tRNA lysidine(34) synthetase TilS [Candidatus Neomarinimicrobiota bacterium]